MIFKIKKYFLKLKVYFLKLKMIFKIKIITASIVSSKRG